ncbi:MAG: hypothetical protein Q4F81_08350 [Eubacteriales bacterium]|nr:hypothetical protein [Eubacteriales bacterium]
MKLFARNTHLHIYHAMGRQTVAHSQHITQKNVDVAVILASIAGLLSAMAFLITMS